MNTTFMKCGRNDSPTSRVGCLLYIALCGLVLLCFAARAAEAQYVSKTIAQTNAQVFIDGLGVAADNSGNVYATVAYPRDPVTQKGGAVRRRSCPRRGPSSPDSGRILIY